LRIKGILVILTIVTITGVGIVFSINQVSTPGLQDLPKASDEVIIDPNADKIDIVETSDEVIIDKQINDVENGLKYYFDENGVKHYIIVAEDTAGGS